MKKFLCMMLVLAMTVCGVAFAEDDLQAQLDEANARIEALEAEVELYKPYYEAQIVVEFGDDGKVWKEDAQAQYEQTVEMYTQYGIDTTGYEDYLKEQILTSMAEEAVLKAKAEELGLTELDEEAIAALQTEAEETFNYYVESYKSYFEGDDITDEEAIASTTAYLNENGLSVETLVEDMINNAWEEALYNYVTADVTIEESDVTAAYEAMLASAEESYSDDYTYNSDRNDGNTIVWNPEGYRAVKHVLIQFTDEQSERYTALQTQLDDLNEELEAVLTPTEEESTEEESSEEEAAEEETEATRTEEEIREDIAATGVEMEALYSELLPEAQEVIDAFNAGTSFDELIEKYNTDPGMTNEPTATIGYAVSEASTTWDSAFTAGAMSIANVGEISAPVYGSYGIHIIYYLNDITPGAVALEDVREAVEAYALDEKISTVYTDTTAAWVEEANIQYHMDRF